MATYKDGRRYFGPIESFGTDETVSTDVLSPVGGGAIGWAPQLLLGGEINTASNSNTEGVGVFYQKTLSDLEFRGVHGELDGLSDQSIMPWEVFEIKNESGAQLDEGFAVVATSVAAGPIYSAEHMDPSVEAQRENYLGIVAANIADTASGYAVRFGLATGADTSTFSALDTLYVSTSTDGELTNIDPGGTSSFKVGVVQVVNASGVVQAIPPGGGGGSDVENLFQTGLGSPHGFPNRTDSVLSYVSGTRTATLAPAVTSFDYYRSGIRYSESGTLDKIHTNATGTYFLYWDSSGTLQYNTTPWDILTDVPIAQTFYNATKGIGITFEERHASNRNLPAHFEFHFTVGTFWTATDGLGLSSYTLQPVTPADADNQWAVAAGVIHDEDISNVITGRTAGTYKSFWRTGASGVWTWDDNNVPLSAGGSYLYYNEWTGATWQQTALANNKFVNYYIVAIGAIDADYDVLTVMGQAEHDNLASAQSETVADVDFGTAITEEMLFAYKVTFSTGAAYSTEGKCRIAAVEDTRRATSRQVIAGAVTPNHNSLGGLQGGAAGEMYHLNSAGHAAVATNTAHVADTTTNPHLTSVANIIAGAGSRAIYVDGGRTDSYTEDGTPARPWLAIQDAIDDISDAATGKRYTVVVYPGDYDENVTLKDYVDLVGIDPRTCRICPTSGTGLYTGTGNNYIMNVGIAMSGGTLSADMIGLRFGTGTYFFHNCEISVTKSGGDYNMWAVTADAGIIRGSGLSTAWTSTGGGGVIAQQVLKISSNSSKIDNVRIDATSADTTDDLDGIWFTAGVAANNLLVNSDLTVVVNGTSKTAVCIRCAGVGAVGVTARNCNLNATAASGYAYPFLIDNTSGGGEVRTNYSRLFAYGPFGSYAGNVASGEEWISSFDKLDGLYGDFTGAGTFTVSSQPSADGDFLLSGDFVDPSANSFAVADGDANTTERELQLLQTEVTGATHNVALTDRQIDLNRAGIIAVTILDTNKTAGRSVHISDAGGNAGTYNHTIAAQTGNVQGVASYPYTVNMESHTFYWSVSANEWRIR